jgi:hypothetical protein
MSVKTNSWLAAVMLGVAPVASAETLLPSFSEKLMFPPGSLTAAAKSTLRRPTLWFAAPVLTSATVAPSSVPATVSRMPVIDPGKVTDEKMIAAPVAATDYKLRVLAPELKAAK